MNIKIFLFLLLSAILINNVISIPRVELKLALVLEGRVDDLGINYIINQGVALTEADLKLSDVKVLSSIDSHDLTYDTIQSNIDRDGVQYNFFITSSKVHADAAIELAKKYSNVYFLVYGFFGNKELPKNVATYYDNPMSYFYMLGYIAGSFSENVGLVVPGPPVENYYTSNSFFAGIKAANKNSKLHVVATSSYDDDDTANGAAQMLLNPDLNINLVSTSQTNMLVPRLFFDKTLFALGSNGFPHSIIYGNKVLQSIVRDYSITFEHVTQLILNDTFVNNPVFYCDFHNGFYKFEDFSFLINKTQVDSINKELESLKAGNTPYLCDPIENGNCKTYDQAHEADIHPGINNLGYYAVPTVEVYSTKGINSTFISLSIIEIALCLIIALVVVIFFKDNLNIKYSTIPFCILLLLGVCLIGAAVFLWNYRYKNDSLCDSRIWMASIGYNLMIGLMIIKDTLIYLKFKKMVATKDTKISPVPISQVLMYFAPLMIIDIILLSIYSGIGEPAKLNDLGLDGIGKYEYTQNCVNNNKGNVVIYIILIFHGLQLLYGCFIAWKTRVVDLEEFVEVHDFATSIYLISFCSFIIIALMTGISSTSNKNTIISAAAIFTSFSCALIVFGSKFWKIYKPVEDDGLPQIKLKSKKDMSNSKSSKSVSASKSSAPADSPNTSALKSINMQAFVNPIESQSKAAANNEE
ncbi:hypothetical protein CYY_002081 [Polysphondylium violaceum]|uniref:G-protein coupled receptors family 3 profile domain-containing protein n=1 Tax=Polysphondylium violaceum TaxID=133409 RepID=A0A8J4PZZ5_9MYCE|nr:hypothetical protein CYY_002081 [Polysphondylium violaceum]